MSFYIRHIRNGLSIGATIVLIVFFLASCNSGRRQEIKSENEVQKVVQKETKEGTAIFNGISLEGWKVTNFGTQGPVYISDGNIILNYGEGCTGITYINDFPKKDYEVSLEAKRVEGNDFFCGITFPVDTTFCSFIVGGWGGPVVGLSTIDGLDAEENDTKTLINFEKEKWYKIRLEVTDDSILCWIDNEKIVDFNIENHKIDIRPEVSLSRPFGIATWNTTGALRNIRLRKL